MDPITIATLKKGTAGYPEILTEMADPPKVLYVWGDPDILQYELIVGVVGTRKPTDYGIRVTAQLTRELSNRAVVVSGLAYGVDTVALSEAVAMNQPAIAVIGSGLDRASFYPSINYQLAEKIVAAGGVIISEYPIGTPPLKQNFPARNRIIAGLAKGVLVVEGNLTSGALITAQFAVELGREVWAVPGNIFAPESAGPNKLIKEGAVPVTSTSDIWETLGLDAQIPLPEKAGVATLIEGDINALLGSESLSVDEIASALKLDSQLVSSTLTLMEIKGMVRLTEAGKFVRLH